MNFIKIPITVCHYRKYGIQVYYLCSTWYVSMIIEKNDTWEFQLVLVHEQWNAPFQRCSTWWISALRTFYIDRILTTVRCTLYVDISLISVGSLLCLYFFRTQQIKLHSRLQEDWLPLKMFFKRWLLPPTWMQLHGFPLSKYDGSFTCHLESLEYSFHICCFTASSSPSPVLNFRAKNRAVLCAMEGERHFHSPSGFLTWWFLFWAMIYLSSS